MLFVVLLFMAAAQSSAIFSPKVYIFVYAATGLAIAFFVTWIFIRLERKSFMEYGLVWRKDTFFKFFKGIVIGTTGFLIILLIFVLFTGLTIERNPAAWHPWTAFWYLPILPLAFMEEIAFRSYPFLKLNGAFGLRITQLIIPIVFALYHIALGWNVHTAFLGPGIWALVFGVAAFYSNGVALPTGIHVALNFSQAIFGMSTGEFEPIWVVHQDESESTAIVGLTTRILVLIAGIILTEFCVRNLQNSSSGNVAR